MVYVVLVRSYSIDFLLNSMEGTLIVEILVQANKSDYKGRFAWRKSFCSVLPYTERVAGNRCSLSIEKNWCSCSIWFCDRVFPKLGSKLCFLFHTHESLFPRRYVLLERQDFSVFRYVFKRLLFLLKCYSLF